jgi:uncharacterized protein (DUF1697 family)
MADLRELFEGLGYTEVATYVQGGNVVFKAQGDAASVTSAIERRGARAELRQLRPDALHVKGKEVYLHTPQGCGRTKLSGGFFEKQLGVVATTRNWRTALKLAELTAA